MRGERLFGQWFDRVGSAGDMRRFVLAELGSPKRKWHGLVHHALMLRAVTRTPHCTTDMRRLVLAVLFHDIVYDATRSDNEEQSALVACRWLDGAEADAVAAMILATKKHDLNTDPITSTLLEADLAVLWTPSPRLYAFYAEGIRAEYAHVPDPSYRAGRVAVLRRLRDELRPHLDPERAQRLLRNVGGEIARWATT